MTEHTVRGIGLPAATGLDVVRSAARQSRDAGYSSFWLNNPPGGNALAMLGEIGEDTGNLWRGVGVIPFSHESAPQILQKLRDSGLPEERLYLGVGSGSGKGGVERVRQGVTALHGETRATLVIAALGPKMCRLAGEIGAGVLLNWLTPEFARTAREWIEAGADAAGRPLPRIMSYVRVAVGDEAVARLRKEAATYESIEQYANHFRRMGVDGMGTALYGSPDAVREGLRAWEGVVDEIVLRVVSAHDRADEVAEAVAAGAPGGA